MGPHAPRPPWEVAQLESLTYHWGDAYSISHPSPGRWVAQRRDTRETLTADSAEDLYKAIEADYGRHPVPR